MGTTANEMRLVVCPGCGDGLEPRFWDDLTYYEDEEYHCDCGVSFLVTRAEGMSVTVETVS